MVSKIQQRAEKIATFRFLEIYWMETLARWTPTTPELEVDWPENLQEYLFERNAGATEVAAEKFRRLIKRWLLL